VAAVILVSILLARPATARADVATSAR
jgi:hypothetical protein